MGEVGLVVALALSAFLMSIAIGSADHSWLGWVTLPPLFLAIRTLRLKWAVASGAFWGACLFAFSASGSNPIVGASLGAFLLMTAAPAGYALFGSVVGRLAGTGVFGAICAGFGWVGVELALRPLSLPTGLLAGTQSGATLIQLGGGLFGYAFVAFLIAFANSLLLAVVTGVCCRIAIPRYRPYADDLDGCPWPLVLSRRPSLLLNTATQPRAPPISVR